jgi:putative ABC transport system ATP-binding protein
MQPSQTAPDDRARAIAMNAVAFSWQRRGGFALSVDELVIDAGERVLLAGPSGAGKSTLLSLLAGIVEPQAGSIAIAGTEITGMSAHRRDRFRAETIGLIFQSFNLIPYLSCLDNILLPLNFAPARMARAGGRSGALAEGRDLLGRIGLDPAVYASQPAGRLSVGQQQRVAVLRALIGGPALIIADEPTSALDRAHQEAFVGILTSEIERLGATLLMVSHDMSLAPLFDRTIALEDVARVERAP